MDGLCEQLEHTKELKAANDELKKRLLALTAKTESLLKRTLELTEELATLKKLATAHRQVPVLSGCSHNILLNCLHNPRLKMPLTTYCSICSAAPRCHTLRLTRKIPCACRYPAPRQKQSCISHSKQVHTIHKRSQTDLLNPTLKNVYTCGLSGMKRSEMDLRTCRHWDLFL